MSYVSDLNLQQDDRQYCFHVDMFLKIILFFVKKSCICRNIRPEISGKIHSYIISECKLDHKYECNMSEI